MNIHKNASMTPKGRAHLVREIDRIGLKPAAAAAGLSTRTTAKWRLRFARGGAGALVDRSSRPHRSPERSCPRKIERAAALRCNQRLTYELIAERLGLSKSAVARACKRAGLAKLPASQDAVPVRRYECASPGERCTWTPRKHRFDKPGHGVTGDRTQNTPRAGSQVLNVAIDDHSRVGFSLLLADEKASSACAFLLAALRYYKALGVRVAQVMTDNGSAYKSRRFAKLLRRLGIRPSARAPTPRAPMARPSDSYRPCCASGPMPSSTPTRMPAPASWRPGCITTTFTAPTQLRPIALQLLALVLIGIPS